MRIEWVLLFIVVKQFYLYIHYKNLNLWGLNI